MRVLFVCTGNICRSPLAEGILREKFRNHGIHGSVDSAGFESFHIGDMPDERARRVARDHGINITGHAARLFTVHDFDLFDKIFVMDSWHYQNVMRLARNAADEAKVDFVTNPLHPGKNIPVQDPYYDGYGAFEKVYLQLDQACEKIADSVPRKNE
jgi:protein-tyrosine phosphatase